MPTAETLSITLPAEMMEIIRAKVDAGRFASGDEVVREAMRGWIERERHLATLEAIIDRSIASLEQSGGLTTEEVRAALLDDMNTESSRTHP